MIGLDHHLGSSHLQDLFVLTMKGDNLVLGVQWLETLGTFKSNYRELMLEFEQGETVITLRGTPHLADLAILGGNLRRLVTRREVAYFCHLICEPSDQADEVTPEIMEVVNQH